MRKQFGAKTIKSDVANIQNPSIGTELSLKT
jgi:hypothetical protein